MSSVQQHSRFQCKLDLCAASTNLVSCAILGIQCCFSWSGSGQLLGPSGQRCFLATNEATCPVPDPLPPLRIRIHLRMQSGSWLSSYLEWSKTDETRVSFQGVDQSRSPPDFGLFFDIDGVIVRGKKLLPHAKEAFRVKTLCSPIETTCRNEISIPTKSKKVCCGPILGRKLSSGRFSLKILSAADRQGWEVFDPIDLRHKCRERHAPPKSESTIKMDRRPGEARVPKSGTEQQTD